MKLTKPQGRELVRRFDFAVDHPGETPPMVRGARISCGGLRKLGLLDKSNLLTLAGQIEAIRRGGKVPDEVKELVANAEELLFEKREALSGTLKELGESDLEGEAFYDKIEAAAAKMKQKKEPS